VIRASERQSRLGSFGPAFHVSAESPKARMFHVPISRLRSSVFGGSCSVSASLSPVTSLTTFGGQSSPESVAMEVAGYYERHPDAR
jgi:hypothetical protein